MTLAVPSTRVDKPVDTPVDEMSDSEMLREITRNSREVRDLVTKVLGDIEQSPLGGMLKAGGGKVNIMSLLMGK